MNKLMKGFAALALCGAVAGTASADVESANICGYQNVQVRSGSSLITPTFKNISQDTMDLLDIQVKMADGTDFDPTKPTTFCNGAILLQKVSPEGNYLTTYKFYAYQTKSATKMGWYKVGTDGSETPVTEKGNCYFAKGEAALVNNSYKNNKVAVPVAFLVSGEVDIEATNIVPSGVSLFGNSTPVDIDIYEISVKMVDGTDIDPTKPTTFCNGAILIQKVSAEGNYLTTYKFYAYQTKSATKMGWYKVGTDGSETPVTTKGVLTFEPGEAFLINNSYKNNKVAVPVAMVLPSPVK